MKATTQITAALAIMLLSIAVLVIVMMPCTESTTGYVVGYICELLFLIGIVWLFVIIIWQRFRHK